MRAEEGRPPHEAVSRGSYSGRRLSRGTVALVACPCVFLESVCHVELAIDGHGTEALQRGEQRRWHWPWLGVEAVGRGCRHHDAR